MRDTSIRERRGGSSAQALSLQHLELGPHSLQNREMQPAPPGPPGQGPSRQSREVLPHSRPLCCAPEGRGPSGGPCWVAGRRTAVSGVPVDAAEKHAAPAQARSPNSLGAGPFPPMGPGSASETPTQAGPRRHGPSHVPPQRAGGRLGALGGDAGARPQWRQKWIPVQVPRGPVDLKMNPELPRPLLWPSAPFRWRRGTAWGLPGCRRTPVTASPLRASVSPWARARAGLGDPQGLAGRCRPPRPAAPSARL